MGSGYIGKGFRYGTNAGRCKGYLDVHCETDVQEKFDAIPIVYAPFSIVSEISSTLDISETCATPSPPAEKVRELCCCIFNGCDVTGYWTSNLYYNGVDVEFPIPVWADIWYSVVYWYGYCQGEFWYNGTYKWTITDPNGIVQFSKSFILLGAQTPVTTFCGRDLQRDCGRS